MYRFYTAIIDFLLPLKPKSAKKEFDIYITLYFGTLILHQIYYVYRNWNQNWNQNHLKNCMIFFATRTLYIFAMVKNYGHGNNVNPTAKPKPPSPFNRPD